MYQSVVPDCHDLQWDQKDNNLQKTASLKTPAYESWSNLTYNPNSK